MNSAVIQRISDSEREKLELILKNNERHETSIISLLQSIQDEFGYLPKNILSFVSERLNIPLAEIYSIATFYTQFKFKEKGKFQIVCCEGTACHVKGSHSLLTFIEHFLGIKVDETTGDKLFSLESVACLGCCAISPVCLINGNVFGNLSVKKIKNILNKLLKENKKAEHQNE